MEVLSIDAFANLEILLFPWAEIFFVITVFLNRSELLSVIYTVLDQTDATPYSVEFLNSFSASGLPADNMALKVRNRIMFFSFRSISFFNEWQSTSHKDKWFEEQASISERLVFPTDNYK